MSQITYTFDNQDDYLEFMQKMSDRFSKGELTKAEKRAFIRHINKCLRNNIVDMCKKAIEKLENKN